jgi:hypothetical protein
VNHITSFADKVQRLKCENDEDYKRSAGVQRNTFEKMPEVVEAGLRDMDRPPKLRRAN